MVRVCGAGPRGYAEALVDGLLTDISELFYIEQLAIEQQIVGTAEHLALRRERSAPVLSRIFASVEEHVCRRRLGTAPIR